jgi:hypothetical protein
MALSVMASPHPRRFYRSAIVPPKGKRFAARLKEERMNYGVEGAKYGISFGTALAIAISYTTNQSILWAIIHGFFSWLYVIYFALFK